MLDIRLEQHANEHRKKRKEPDVSSDYETLESKKPREYIENIIRYSANDLVTPVKYDKASAQAMPPIYESSYKTPVKNLFADYGGSRKKRKTRKQRKRTYKQKKNKSRK